MCLVIVSKRNQSRPDHDILKQSVASNPHGNGIAWNAKGKVYWRKGITLDDIVSMLALIPAESNVVIHNRLATVGEASSALCHPFPIGGSLALEGNTRDGIIAHNGHMHNWRELLLAVSKARIPRGPWSDSRAIAILARYGNGVLELVDEKIVLLTPKRVKLFGSGWKDHNGFIVSNLNFQVSYGYPTLGVSIPLVNKRSEANQTFEDARNGYFESLAKERNELREEIRNRSLGDWGHWSE